MTADRDFKRLVRERMARTGERYAAARAALEAQPPPAARTAEEMPSDRVSPERAFYDRTVRTFFDGERLRSIPNRRRARVVVLLELLRRFERGRGYTELEVNGILRTALPDVASLRRALVEYGYVTRSGGEYRVVDVPRTRDANEAQEVPADEALRIAAVPVAAPRRSDDDA